jgi:hypothetical protein
MTLSALAEPNLSRAFGNDLRHASDRENAALGAARLGRELSDSNRPLPVKSNDSSS